MNALWGSWKMESKVANFDKLFLCGCHSKSLKKLHIAPSIPNYPNKYKYGKEIFEKIRKKKTVGGVFSRSRSERSSCKTISFFIKRPPKCPKNGSKSEKFEWSWFLLKMKIPNPNFPLQLSHMAVVQWRRKGENINYVWFSPSLKP